MNIVEFLDLINELVDDVFGMADIADAFAESNCKNLHGSELLAKLIRQHGERLGNLPIKDIDKEEAPCTAATGEGAKMIHNIEKDSMKGTEGQALFNRVSFRKYAEIRKAYENDWQYSISGENGIEDFFKILAIAYETGWENGIRQERARRRRK